MRRLMKTVLALTILVLLAPAAWAAPERHRLSNGLTVITDENHEAPVTAFQVWVRAGSAYEREPERGITHLIEHMIFKGTPSRPAGEMAKKIEALGGEVNAYTTYDHTNYYVVTSSANSRQALSILSDAVVNASFDPGELTREKEVVVEEIRMNQNDPGRRLSWEVMRLAFGDHPYGRPIIGSEESVRAITREDILAYRDRWYRAPDMVVVAVGDFHTRDVLPLVEKAFAGLNPQPAEKFVIPPVDLPPGPRLSVMREKVSQASVTVSWLTPGLPSPEVYPLDVAAGVMGEGETSRLYTSLKEGRGLVDGVGAWSYTPDKLGLFQVQADLAPDKVGAAWEPLLEETLDLAGTPPTGEEMRRSRVRLAADFIRGRQTRLGQARLLGYFEMFWGGFEKLSTYLEGFRAVRPEEVAGTARKYFRPQGMSMVIQIPEDAPAPDLAQVEALAEKLAARFQTSPPPAAETRAHVPTAPPAPAAPEAEAAPAKPRRAVLDNGLVVLLKPQTSSPLVSMILAAPGGQSLETEDKAGLSNLWTRAVNRGAGGLTYQEITRELEDMAGSLNGFMGKSTLGLTGSFLAGDWEKGLDIMAKTWNAPSFEPEEVEKVRQEQAAALRAQEDNPVARAAKDFRKLLYGKHPYGLNPLGAPETLKALTREDLTAYHRRISGPRGAVLTLVGDFDPDHALTRIKELFGGSRGRAAALPAEPVPPVEKPRTLELTDKGARQTQILMGCLAPGALDPKRYAMRILESVLGGQGGRLFTDLRDKLSLAYAVQPFYDDYRDTGVLGVYMGVGPGKEGPAVKGLEAQLDALRQAPPSAEEMKRAKTYVLGQRAIALETYAAQAMTMTMDELLGLGWLAYLDEPLSLEAVSAADIQGLAARWLLPEQRVLLIMGPEDSK